MPEVPSKTHLDAHADQTLAAVRDMREDLSGMGGAGHLLSLSDGLAVVLREQFPGVAELGRITLAVAGALESIENAGRAMGCPLSRLELSAIAALAAEQLEREADHG